MIRRAMSSLPSNLPALVKQKYSTAASSGALIFSPTEVAVLPTTPPFQLRYCPSLRKKPTPNAPDSKPHSPSSTEDAKGNDDKKQESFDPFAAPPEELLVAKLEAHNLVLNKFPIIKGHSILATTNFHPQTGPLTECDLAAVYAVLRAYSDNGERAVGFFNSGPESGASQARRHVQILPFESVKTEGWGVLVDGILEQGQDDGGIVRLPGLQLWHAAVRLRTTEGKELQAAYERLLSVAFGRRDGGWEAVTGRESYNLAFTEKGMAITRRTRGEYELEGRKLSINGTILIGTLMVKGEEEWDLLRKEPGRLEEVLRGISGPPASPVKDKL